MIDLTELKTFVKTATNVHLAELESEIDQVYRATDDDRLNAALAIIRRERTERKTADVRQWIHTHWPQLLANTNSEKS